MATYKIFGITFCVCLEEKIKQKAKNEVIKSSKLNLLEEHGYIEIPEIYKPFSIEWHIYKDAFNRERGKFFRSKK